MSLVQLKMHVMLHYGMQHMYIIHYLYYKWPLLERNVGVPPLKRGGRRAGVGSAGELALQPTTVYISCVADRRTSP